MLTGMYPHQHGLWANGVSLPAEEVSLPSALREAGYRTGLVGKFHLTACYDGRSEERSCGSDGDVPTHSFESDSEEPSDYGFDWVRWAHDPGHRSPKNAYHGWLRGRHPDLFAEASKEQGGGSAGSERSLFHLMPSEAHYSSWAAEEAVDFIVSSRAGERWLLWVNFFDPHHPFVAPKEYLEAAAGREQSVLIGSVLDLEDRPGILRRASERSYAGVARGFQDYQPKELAHARVAYWAMVDLIDEQVGRILKAAEAAGDVDDLLVLFTRDHGEMLGDHGLMLKGPMMYEGAVRVPCIVRWPGHLDAGKRVAGLMGVLDLASTISEAADLAPPRGNVGRSLLSVGGGTGEPHKRVFAEYRSSGHPYEPPVWTTMVREGRYKLVLWHGNPDDDLSDAGELYDLELDPEERVNLWSNGEVVAVRAELVAKVADCLALGGRGWGERRALW